MTADQLIDRLNTATDGKRLQARILDVVGGGGGGATGVLTSYTDGGGPQESQLQLREMRVVVTADTPTAKSVAINEAKLEELCSDVNGCSVTLGATRFRDQRDGLTVEGYVIAAPLNGGECRFYLNTATHSWTLSQDCVAPYGIYAANQTTHEWEFSRVYQRYEYSNAYGFDGSGIGGAYTCGAKQNGDIDDFPLIVMSFKGACYFTEAPADTDLPDPNTGCFETDSTHGFYLIASHPSWDYPGAYPKADSDPDGDGFVNNPDTGQNTTTPARRPWPEDDPTRHCILTIKD
jgi:hypothetical protein